MFALATQRVDDITRRVLVECMPRTALAFEMQAEYPKRKECEGQAIRKLGAWPTEGGCQLPIHVSAPSREYMHTAPLLASHECLLAHRNEYYAGGHAGS